MLFLVMILPASTLQIPENTLHGHIPEGPLTCAAKHKPRQQLASMLTKSHRSVSDFSGGWVLTGIKGPIDEFQKALGMFSFERAMARINNYGIGRIIEHIALNEDEIHLKTWIDALGIPFLVQTESFMLGVEHMTLYGAKICGFWVDEKKARMVWDYTFLPLPGLRTFKLPRKVFALTPDGNCMYVNATFGNTWTMGIFNRTKGLNRKKHHLGQARTRNGQPVFAINESRLATLTGGSAMDFWLVASAMYDMQPLT